MLIAAEDGVNFFDDTVKSLMNMLPAGWQPYIIVLFILLYAGTKVNNWYKSTQVPVVVTKDLSHPPTLTKRVIDFIF